MAQHPATARPYNPLWDGAAPARRKGSRLAVALSLAAHAAVIWGVYETKFAPHYKLHGEAPPLVVDFVPRAKKPPPPPEAPPPPPERLPPPRPVLDVHETIPPLDIGVPTIPFTVPELPRPQIVEPPLKPAPPPVITSPNWSARPSGEDMARYYPDRAQRLGLPGRAVIQCQVTAKGAVDACAVVSEDPAGYGFGDAAQKLSKLFKMKPRLEDGRPVEGATVRIPIVFRID